MRLKIATDIDDVSLNFIDPFIDFLEKEYDIFLERKKIYTYKIEEILNEPRIKFEKKLKKFYNSVYFRNLPPISGAQSAFKKIKERGDELIIVTSRSDEFRKVTEENLKTYFGDNFSEIFYSKSFYRPQGKTKAEICQEENACFLNEDCMIYALECNLNKIPVLLFNQPWNRGNLENTLITRVKGWKEVLEKLGELN